MKSYVLTADIAGSAQLPPAKLKKAIALAKICLSALRQNFGAEASEIFRGDSMQSVWTKNGTKALAGAIWLVLKFKANEYHLRLGFGMGNIRLFTGKPATSNGEAFVISGSLLDEMKNTSQLIRIGSTFENDLEWKAHSAALNYILERCTLAQSAVLSHALENKTQQEIAGILNIRQPAVSQHLQAAGWPAIQAILLRFEYIAGT